MISLTRALEDARRLAGGKAQVLSSAHVAWSLLQEWRRENPHPALANAQEGIALGFPHLACSALGRAPGSGFFDTAKVAALFPDSAAEREPLDWMQALLRPGGVARPCLEDAELLERLVICHLRVNRLWMADGPRPPSGSGRRLDARRGWSAEELQQLYGRDADLERLHLNLLQAMDSDQPFLLVAPQGAGSALFLRHLLHRVLSSEPRPFVYLDKSDYGQTPAEVRQTFQHLLLTLANDPRVIAVLDDFSFLARISGLLPVAQEALSGLLLGGERSVILRCHDEYLGLCKPVFQDIPPHFLDSLTREATREVLKFRWNRQYPAAPENGSLDRLFELLDRHFAADPLPGRALDLLDRAGVIARNRNGNRPTPPQSEDLTRCVSVLLKLNPELAGRNPREFYPQLACRLKARVFGQDHAVDRLCQELYANSLRPPRNLPRGRFLFVGPPGTGKTRLAHCLAEELGYDREAFHAFNMGEFTGEGARNRFLGSDPGYRDFGGTFTIFKALQRTPACVILLDEIDRAHASIQDVLLGLLEGRGRDAYGVRYNLQQVVFIMTTNQQQEMVESVWRSVLAASKDEPLTEEALKQLRHDVCNQLEAQNDLRKALVQHSSSLAEGRMKDHLQRQLDALGAAFLDDTSADAALDQAKGTVLQQFIATRQGLAALTTQHLKSALDRALLDRIDYIVPFLPLHHEHLRRIVESELAEEGWQDCPEPIKRRITAQVTQDSVGGRDVRRLIRQAFRQENPMV